MPTHKPRTTEPSQSDLAAFRKRYGRDPMSFGVFVMQQVDEVSEGTDGKLSMEEAAYQGIGRYLADGDPGTYEFSFTIPLSDIAKPITPDMVEEGWVPPANITHSIKVEVGRAS